MNEPLPIFVYGTLKRGEERATLWPCKPQRVEVATTLGRLFDLGPYPALVAGDDVVEGELWYVTPEDLPGVLQALDRIEGFVSEGNSLYQRRAVTCRNAAGQMLAAYAYFYARPADLAGKTPLAAGGDGCSRWRGKMTK